MENLRPIEKLTFAALVVIWIWLAWLFFGYDPTHAFEVTGP